MCVCARQRCSTSQSIKTGIDDGNCFGCVPSERKMSNLDNGVLVVAYFGVDHKFL